MNTTTMYLTFEVPTHIACLALLDLVSATSFSMAIIFFTNIFKVFYDFKNKYFNTKMLISVYYGHRFKRVHFIFTYDSRHINVLAVSCLEDRSTKSSSSVQGCSDIDCVRSSLVTTAGGRIALPESGVSLMIPEGAIPKGAKEQMYLAVLRDDRHRPKLPGEE